MSDNYQRSGWLSRPVRRVETSPLFWRDLESYRNTPLYPFIRSSISRFLGKVIKGENGGDAPFTGNTIWGDVRHLHVFKKKEVLFITYHDDAVRLCAIKPHTFYGYRSEKKSMAGKAAEVIIRSSTTAPQPFPDYKRINWTDPAQIITSPDLLGLSRDGLDLLLREIDEESENFRRLVSVTEKMTPENQKRVSNAWLEDLVAAHERVAQTILIRAGYRHSHTPLSVFEGWDNKAEEPECC